MKPAMLVALAASLVAAQDQLGQIPTCARGCVTNFISDSGVAGCQKVDFACICKNKDFLNSIACCLAGTCNTEDQDKTVSFAAKLCGAAGVQVPSKVVCSSGSAQPTSDTAAPKTTASVTTTGVAPKSTAAAAPMLGGAGGVVGVVLAMLAAV